MAEPQLQKGASIATLIVVCLVFFVDIANIGMANIALPTIKQDLKFDEGTLQWILTAYSLTFGGFLMAGGRAGDIYGHKQVLVCGMTLFNAACLLCALVDQRIGLVVGRAVQGLAAAFTIPSAQSLVALAFESPQARVRAFGVWGACGSSGFVFGPILGGLFTTLLTWQWIFWISLIVEGALELATLALILTHQFPSKAREKLQWSKLYIQLDAMGTSLSVCGLILLVYGLTIGNVDDWDNVSVISTLVIGGTVLLAFVFVEVKLSSNPVLPRYIWGDRTRALGCAIAALTYAIWQGSNYLLSLQLQALGMSALSTAVHFLPLGVTALLINFIIPVLLKPIGTRKLLFISWILVVIGLVLLTQMNSRDQYWQYCLPGMILYIAGIGTVYFVGNVTVVATASQEKQGTVSGVYNMFLNVGGAVLGVAVLTVISNSVASNNGGTKEAILEGYKAGYYGALGMTGLGFLLSVFFKEVEPGMQDSIADESLQLQEVNC